MKKAFLTILLTLGLCFGSVMTVCAGDGTSRAKAVDDLTAGNSRRGVIGSASAKVWYKIRITKAGYFTVMLKAENEKQIANTWGWNLHVYSGDGTTELVTIKQIKTSAVTIPIPFDPGTFYLVVDSVNNASAPVDKGFYIQFDETEASDWESEGNDIENTADLITLDKVYKGNFWKKDDVDWYKVNTSLSAGSRGYFEVGFSADAGADKAKIGEGWTVSIYRETQKTGEDEEKNDPLQVMSKITTTDTSAKLPFEGASYYIKVEAGNNADSASETAVPIGQTYNLSVKQTRDNAWELENDDAVGSANPIVVDYGKDGKGASGNYIGNLYSATDADYYKFTIPDIDKEMKEIPRIYKVSVNFNPIFGRNASIGEGWTLSVFADENAGALISGQKLTKAETLGGIGMLPGDYYIKISNTNENAPVNIYNAYSIQVTAGQYEGWMKENGNDYWYEKGIRQGYDPIDKKSFRGKEIYDPGTNAWYWLDNVDQGKKAVSKDVYQESAAGTYADRMNGTGKWVRYDANGRMIKGWCAGKGETAVEISSPDEANGRPVYYFDPIYGSMAKSSVILDGVNYNFDHVTGVLKEERQEVSVQNKYFGWVNIDGKDYWYEGGVRQGVFDRGKEIYDPGTDGWYWLDAIYDGAKAVSKDAYQESSGGKWCRYDATGKMVKGWCAGKDDNIILLNSRYEAPEGMDVYYFDPITGKMQKEMLIIGDQVFTFDEKTGVFQREGIVIRD